MRILITNDDGLHAEGVLALAQAARQFGEVILCCPDRERSACGHAMTMRDPLRVKESTRDGLRALEVNGLPVDCVNVALTTQFPDGCDLVLSGFNHGPNMGFDVTYSGTVAGAMEGTINGIRSVSLSMAVFADGAPFHFETGTRWVTENWHFLTTCPLPERTFLNVNIPAIAYPELSGTEIVPLTSRVYEDRVEVRTDPWGRPYYWQGGVVIVNSRTPNTDVHTTSRGCVAVTPITLDWTNHTAIEGVRQALGTASAVRPG